MKNIIQRISLEGGAAIKAELQGIGAAGQKAFGDLQSAITSNRAFGNIGAAIDSVKAKAAQLSTAGGQLGKDLGDLGGSANRIAAIFGVTLTASITGVVAAISKLTASSASVGTNLQKSADATGTTTDNFQALTSVAGRFGVSGEEIAKVLTRINGLADEQVKGNLTLQRSQADLTRQFGRGEISMEAYVKAQRDLREKAAEQSTIFDRLGVSATNADGSVKDSVELFKDFSAALADVPDKANRAGLALQITGARNAGINRIFNLGADGIDKFAKQVEAAEPKLSRLQISVSAGLDIALRGLRGTFDSLKNSVGIIFAPNETRLVKAFQDLIVASREKVLAFASDIATKVTPIVDDLIAVMQGRDKDVKNNIILVIRDGIVSFATDVKNAVTNIILPALAGLLKILDTVAQAINGLFGTKLTGGQIAVAVVIANAIGIFGLFTAAVKVAVSAIGLLVAAFGPVGIAIAAVGFAIGFVLVRALQSIDWAGVAKSAQAAWNTITGAVAGVRDAIVGAFTTAINFVIDAWNGVLNFFTGLGQAIGSAFNTAAIAISNAFNTSVQFVTDLWNGLLNFFASLPATIGGFFVSVGNAIVNAFNSAVDTVKGLIDSLWQKITSVFNAVVERARAVGNAIAAAFGAGSDASAGGNASGFAGGGVVRGPGTSRSDSIPALLSNGEFVIPERAVRHYGVGFFEALRQLRANATGFNAGGLVSAMTPESFGGVQRFADGGLAVARASGGGTPVHLHLPGGVFGPLMADDAVLASLKRKAVAGRMRSTGRKPSFVGA